MAENKFTPAQSAAIKARGCDLLVSAAAGSGKTAVLVERIIRRVIDDGVDIDKLLVVTFTEAAASEMRRRIYKAVSEAAKEQPTDRHLQKQLLLINRANITTIHSFCLSVVRQYYHVLNIDPSFRVADVTEIALLKAEIIRELFEDWYDKEDDDFYRLIEFYGDKVADDSLQKLVLEIYEFSLSNPCPREWLMEQAESFNIGEQEEPCSAACAWYKYLLDDLTDLLEGALNSANKALVLADNVNLHEKYYEVIDNDRSYLLAALNALKSGGLDMVYNALNFEFGRLTGAKSKTADGSMTDEEIKDLKERIKDIRNGEIKDIVTDIREKALFKVPEELFDDIKASYGLIKTLVNVVNDFADRFYSVKREKNIADFNDFEHLCLKALLKNGSGASDYTASEIAAEIRASFDEIYIDEYQDSNLIQELILLCVSSKSDGVPNRFMVGDIKQSIYRFRMANPDLFRDKYNSFDKHTDDTGQAQKSLERVINLSKNFRSRSGVLNGINFLFKQLMSERIGEINYDDDAALNFGADYYDETVQNNFKSEMHIVVSAPHETDGENYDELSDDINTDDTMNVLMEMNKYEAEAGLVAERILDLIGGENPFMVTDRDGKLRNAQYRDIVILLRSPGPVSDVFTNELKKKNIPSYDGGAKGYFDSAEIMTILSLLKVIDNPRQDIPLISVLYSPVFMFGTDELVEIRRAAGGDRIFYECIMCYTADNNNGLSEKLNRFLQTLNGWRDKAVYTDISTLIWDIYSETGYYDLVGVMEGGTVRRANLVYLFERAAQYEKTSLKGLFHFIAYIEKLQKGGLDVNGAKTLGENENLVRIMSIHKSKGLEFPIVFVSCLGKKFNLTDVRKKFIMHKDLGFGSVYIDLENRIKSNTLNRYAIGRKILRESLSEELRVLYVALTRAKEKLILTGSVDKLDNVLKKMESAAEIVNLKFNTAEISDSTFLDWILKALSRHRDLQKLITVEIPNKELFNDPSEWEVFIRTKAEIVETEQKKSDKYSEIVEQLGKIDYNRDYSGKKGIIADRLGFVYPFKRLSEIPSKISVSEIKRLYHYELLGDGYSFDFNTEKDNGSDEEIGTVSFSEPVFIAGEKKPTAAGTGIMLHTVMEHIDFFSHTSRFEILQFLTGLENERILNKGDSSYVDVRAVEAFMSSETADRIRRSGFVKREARFVTQMPISALYPDWNAKPCEMAESCESIILHGIIDCLFEENGGFVIVDYKTDKIGLGGIEAAAEKYNTQMSYYKQAVEKNTGRKVLETILYFFSVNQAVSLR